MLETPFASIARSLIPFLEGETRVLAAYLLGSAVSGRMRPDSDVDLGLLGSGNLIYAKEAIFTGIRIFSRNDAAADAAEATLLGMYVSFNEERQEVLDAYRA
jgi:predicted nucleotidyltransferase